jgi:hypothetical protein
VPLPASPVTVAAVVTTDGRIWRVWPDPDRVRDTGAGEAPASGNPSTATDIGEQWASGS